MFRKIVRAILCSALVMFAAATTGGDDAAPGRSKRIVVPVKFGLASDLAGLLNQHFEGDAAVRVVAEPVSNCLFINATPEVFDELLKTLSQLDRRPRAVAVEVLIAELAPATETTTEGQPAAKSFDEKTLAGPVEKAAEKLDQLMKAGMITGFKQFRLTTLDNQETKVQASAETSITSNVTVNVSTELANRIFERRTIGTIITVTPHLTDDRNVTLKLLLRDDRLHTPEKGESLGNDKNGPIIPPDIVASILDGKVSVPLGQAVVVQGLSTDSKSKETRLVVIVGAHLVEPQPVGAEK